VPDMAAFVNCTAAAYPAMTDSYHRPGSDQGHASETVAPLLAAGEHARRGGREFITSIVLGYEVFLSLSDVFKNPGFDQTNFGCVGTAVAAGKLIGLSRNQLSHCISMAVVPNNILKQVKRDHQSMFKAVAAGQAGRAGIFAVLLARAGMEGPHLPFEGKAGWCDHIARNRFSLGTLGGNGTSFKILDTLIKTRPSEGKTISAILAAEQLGPINIKEVKQVTVEVYQRAWAEVGSGEIRWNPGSRQDADHSIPYVVAATLMDGKFTLRSFNDAHLWNPDLRGLMQKIEVVENAEFTKAFEQQPQQHRTRLTVLTNSGERRVAESGGNQDGPSAQIWAKNDSQIVEKFRGLTEEYLGTRQVNAILDRLWNLEDLTNVAEIPPYFVLA